MEANHENKIEEIPAGIRNVVFDLGGVVIDLTREKAVKCLEELGLEKADELLGLYRQEEPFLGLETGMTPVGEVFDSLRGMCRPGTTDSQITEAFEAFLDGIPRERLEALRRLRHAGFNVYALSNTNPVMFTGWISREFRKEGKGVRDYFDGIVVSFEEGTCKPDAEIFSTVLRRYELAGNETLMLDDSAANCQAAETAGMHAFRIDNRTKGREMTSVADSLIASK